MSVRSGRPAGVEEGGEGVGQEMGRGGGCGTRQDDHSYAPRHYDGDDCARSCARIVALVGVDAARGVA